MDCKPYSKGNRFSQYTTIADAAVEWQGLTPEQIELVVVNEDGLPYLAGVQDLTDRAEAILEAAQERQIGGHTHTEDGYARRASQMQLLRDSVNAWMAKANTRIATPPPEVAPHASKSEPEYLTTTDVYKRLRWSRSKLLRNIDDKLFPAPTHPDRAGNKWRTQVVQDYIDAHPDKLGT
jgi:hypothetical protein